MKKKIEKYLHDKYGEARSIPYGIDGKYNFGMFSCTGSSAIRCVFIFADVHVCLFVVLCTVQMICYLLFITVLTVLLTRLIIVCLLFDD